MKKNYVYNIPGKNFQPIKGKFLNTIKEFIGKSMMHGGIYYDPDGNKIVFLSSNNISDLHTAVEYQMWQHSHKPKRIDSGWQAYIVPSKGAIERANRLGIDLVGVKFDIIGKVNSKKEDIKWPSLNKEEV